MFYVQICLFWKTNQYIIKNIIYKYCVPPHFLPLYQFVCYTVLIEACRWWPFPSESNDDSLPWLLYKSFFYYWSHILESDSADGNIIESDSLIILITPSHWSVMGHSTYNTSMSMTVFLLEEFWGGAEDWAAGLRLHQPHWRGAVILQGSGSNSLYWYIRLRIPYFFEK